MPEEESAIPPETRDFKAPEEHPAPDHEKAFVEQRMDAWLENKRKKFDIKPDESYTEGVLRHAWRKLTGRDAEERPKE